MKYSKDIVIYSINVDDLQTVATEQIDRNLNDDEIELVRDCLGNYIDWYEAITLALGDLNKSIINKQA